MENKNSRLREEIIRISGANPKKCMKCGKCTATCPSYDGMEFHPHEFVSMIDKGDIAPLLSSDSVFRCLTCYACAERCPRGVEPAKLIEAVRVLRIRQKDGNHLTPDKVYALTDEDTPGQALMSAFRKYAK